jgi:hypothetical protein
MTTFYQFEFWRTCVFVLCCLPHHHFESFHPMVLVWCMKCLKESSRHVFSKIPLGTASSLFRVFAHQYSGSVMLVQPLSRIEIGKGGVKSTSIMKTVRNYLLYYQPGLWCVDSMFAHFSFLVCNTLQSRDTAQNMCSLKQEAFAESCS